MNYLRYIELAAENLQFFLWLRDYTKRFNELPDSEKALSPEWTGADFETENNTRTKYHTAKTATIFKGTDFADGPKVVVVEKSNPFFTPPRTPTDEKAGLSPFDSDEMSMTSGGKVDHTQRATGAFEGAGLKWKPCEYTDILFS